MKHNHDGKHVQKAASKRSVIHFNFKHPTAEKVFVAGTFNQWKPASDCLHRIGTGHWVGELALAPGTYEYRLVVDGSWMADPAASDTSPNPFGGCNSILTVPSSHQAGRRADAMAQPLKHSNP